MAKQNYNPFDSTLLEWTGDGLSGSIAAQCFAHAMERLRLRVKAGAAPHQIESIVVSNYTLRDYSYQRDDERSFKLDPTTLLCMLNAFEIW